MVRPALHLRTGDRPARSALGVEIDLNPLRMSKIAGPREDMRSQPESSIDYGV